VKIKRKKQIDEGLELGIQLSGSLLTCTSSWVTTAAPQMTEDRWMDDR
jgi:hypothetical protein